MFKVKKERCNECLYSKDKIVSDERRKNLLSDIQNKDSHFVCHKATIKNEDVCCKGFYDSSTSNMIRISQRLNMVEFVD